jgi:U4/U6.U5 tri-snRNP-associated protein 1
LFALTFAPLDERFQGFRLGANIVSKKAAMEEEQQHQAAAVNKSLLSIDYISEAIYIPFGPTLITVLVENMETADYLKPGDIGFKKPKTKKKRPSKRAGADVELAEEDEMQVDEKPATRVRDLDANFVDDDELQAALASSRRAKLRKPKKLSPEELAAKSKSFCHCTRLSSLTAVL